MDVASYFKLQCYISRFLLFKPPQSAVHQADQKKTPIKILSMSPADPKEIAAHMTIM